MTNFEKAILIDPEFAEAYNNRSLIFSSYGRYDLAIENSDMAIKLNPDLAKAYFSRGIAFNEKGEYSKAIADLESFLDVVNIVEIITVENDKLIAIDSVFYEDKIEEAIKKNEK